MKPSCWRGGVLTSVFWQGEVCCLLLAGLSWCAVRGSMLFPRIPAACSWGTSALILAFICFLLDVTQALGWTLPFCVLEKITKPFSDFSHKWKIIEGEKSFRVVFACEALRGWASHCWHLWRGAGEPRAALLCEGVDHRCHVWPGYLPSCFQPPPAPRTCAVRTGFVLSLHTSVLKALCSCDPGIKLMELMWAEQSSSSVCSRLNSLSGWVGLSWLGLLAGTAETGPPFAVCSCASEFEACGYIMFAFSSFSLTCCSCISPFVSIYLYLYL